MADVAFAYASIDWAVSNMPSFEERMQVWLKTNVGVRIKQLDSDPANNMLIAFNKGPLPLAFSVEAGAYINAIRSSLDILATAMAHRHGMPNKDNVHFPIAKSESAFMAGNYKGADFVKGLPKADRRKIELLKPYQGGNPLLWQLHHLDNVRKHRRLLDTQTRPAKITATGWDAVADLRNMPHADPSKITHLNGETELGLVSKFTNERDFKITAQIAITEAGCLYGYSAVIAILYLANMARDAIKILDRP